MTITGFTLNNGATTQPSSMTGTVPATVAVGDVMVVVSCQNTSSATHTISGGGSGITWHLQSGPDDNSSNERTYVWTATAVASSASSTVTVSSSSSGRLIGAGWCGSGLTETGLVVGMTKQTTSGTSMPFPAVTVTAAGSTLVGLVVMRTGTTTAATLTAPSGCTVDATSALAISTAPEYTAVSLHETATVGTGSQSPGTGSASGTVTNAQLYTLALPAAATGSVAAAGTGTVTVGGSGSAAAAGASGTGTVTVGGSATPTGAIAASGTGTVTVGGSGTPTLPPPPVQFLPLPPMDDQQRQGLTVAVYDYSYTLQGYANDYESCQVTFQHMDVGTGTLVLPETHPLVPQINLAGNQVVPVTVTDRFGHRWTGRVDAPSTDDGDGSTQAVPGSGLTTVTLIDEWTWLKRLLAAPWGASTQMAYGSGDPEFDVRTGPLETVAKGYISDACARRWGIDVAGNPLGPIVVVPPPVSDPSVTVTLQAKWTPLADLLAETLRTYSWTLTVTLWLPGDPQPVGLVAPLTVPTLVVDMHKGADNAWIVYDDDTLMARKVAVKAPASYGAVIGGSGSGTAQTFATYVDTGLQASQGTYGFPEQFFTSTSTSTSASITQDAATQLNKTEGSLGVAATVESGTPWTYGDDFAVGDVVGIRALGIDVRERVTAVQMADDRLSGYRLLPTIGDDTATLTPLAALFKTSRELGSRIATLETGQ